ncbi:MazG nucleotide pyrophosphohydrolase domain-containing protein [Paenibacillus eucommiae]|uniref:NTP pyrophosphatase (Non-canonical NTP hydrolase) n=1 Tax=Paenibacillus eucommiae TaxID=1355755 RepID=A0ABS4JDA0_9BACL|nr:MazG nucleotide pyrophosphohydrolase domain-containing protein [Paenibacillus eucommiae]MBP1996689.1 NTP pyrophosphatase (non-canonical NTP hydrolase) [Paenibacillus eucommiae]
MTSLRSNITLNELQQYIKNKDFNPDASAYFYKLIEEVGELAEVIRKNKRQEAGNIKDSIEEELSDVLYYTIALANVFQINLEESFKQKEELNKLKWGK